ncbi:glycosyltransferase [Schlesneria sp. DSM 10557]|uniref:glycosyltransferase n=1 Tax=Schlesneria sp. DSM 10557 TaxID=3044399 RepID=UPI0035A15098
MTQRGSADPHAALHESGPAKTDAPVRIAFCITDLDRGGAERALVQLACHLDRTHWEPHVICLGPRGVLVDELEAAGITVVCLGARGLGSTPCVLWQLVKELRRFKPAIVQTFLFHANILGRIAARIAGIQIVVSGVRVAERRNRWHGWIDRWTNFLVQTNVCVSRGVAEFSATQGGLSPRKLVVIPNAVEADKFKGIPAADLTKLGIPASSRVCISVGRLECQKGFDVLVDAISRIKPLPADVYFLIVGDGPDADRLGQQVERLGLERQIRFLGRRDDVPELLAASQLFILSSRWEGMPNVVLEAMAAGLPVVATEVEGIAELIQDSVNGVTVRPGEAPPLAAAIESCLARPEFLASAGFESQHMIQKRFTPSVAVSSYAQIYRELLERSPI